MNPKTKRAIKQLNALKRYNKKLRLAAEWKERWMILISTILSAQTKDETTIKISEILYKKYPSLLYLAKASLKDIKKIIKPINYYKTKAEHILETAKIITKNKGKIPKTREGLMELPGVGLKVSNVYLAVAHKIDCIGVDVHVARISNKLGWSKEKDKYKIEKDLEALFPRKYWRAINYILVTFGRRNTRKVEDEILERIR